MKKVFKEAYLYILLNKNCVFPEYEETTKILRVYDKWRWGALFRLKEENDT